jgi:hypothetical protein
MGTLGASPAGAAVLPRSSVGAGLAALIVGVLAFVALPAVIVTTLIGGSTTATGLGDGTGMPEGAMPFLRIYEDAASAYDVSPYLLMATHEDETSFSISTQPGVQSGTNFAGCCAGPMQFFISGSATPKLGGAGATWAQYRQAARRAGIPRPPSYPGRFAEPSYPNPNVYDSFDALYAAASYFHDEGAGRQLDAKTYQALLRYKGTPPASIPYARHDYERALELQRIAEANGQAGGQATAPAFGDEMVRVRASSPWRAPVPGFRGEECDRRILPNLLYLIQRYRLAVTDCYALSGHAADGEHPMGLGVDLVPGPGGSWSLIARLAAAAEPSQGAPRPPFRWVGWNGDSNHGDPAHAGRNAHLHLSWEHGAGGFNQQAEWVLVAR